jgi:hypothetical protein
MSRIARRILWIAAFLIVVSCTAKREEVILPPPGPTLPPPPAQVPEPTPPAPSPARLEVVQLQLTANREFVGARIRLSGEELSGVDPAEIYMVDEATGEKFPVMRLQRIGKLAEFNVPGEEGTRYVMFRNREGMLKAGKRVTIVVGKTRQEHLLIRR